MKCYKEKTGEDINRRESLRSARKGVEVMLEVQVDSWSTGTEMETRKAFKKLQRKPPP